MEGERHLSAHVFRSPTLPRATLRYPQQGGSQTNTPRTLTLPTDTTGGANGNRTPYFAFEHSRPTRRAFFPRLDVSLHLLAACVEKGDRTTIRQRYYPCRCGLLQPLLLLLVLQPPRMPLPLLPLLLLLLLLRLSYGVLWCSIPSVPMVTNIQRLYAITRSLEPGTYAIKTDN